MKHAHSFPEDFRRNHTAQPVRDAGSMPLLRTEEHEGVIKVGTTAANRFTMRLKGDDDFKTREIKKQRSAHEPQHQGRGLCCNKPHGFSN